MKTTFGEDIMYFMRRAGASDIQLIAVSMEEQHVRNHIFRMYYLHDRILWERVFGNEKMERGYNTALDALLAHTFEHFIGKPERYFG